jgi:integrase
MLPKRRKKRIPKLSFTKIRNIGWYLSYRDPATRIPRKHRFGMIAREAADIAYHEWVSDYLKGKSQPAVEKKRAGRRRLDFAVMPDAVNLKTPPTQLGQGTGAVISGSLLHIASGFLRHEEGRVRAYGEAKRQGSIHPENLVQRKQLLTEFLEFLNGKYGKGAVGRMTLADLLMEDVEEYNRAIVNAKYSDNIVVRRLQVIKNLIDRAGRPEYGGQTLKWNWESRDVLHGLPPKRRVLPTADQLRKILDANTARERAMIWMALGLGFGQHDLSVIRVGQIDEKSYDLRRGKTGMERYGETPTMVWTAITEYLKATKRPVGELMFVTRRGMPVVHGTADSVQLWWYKQRISLGETTESLSGFYTLRHLGATEFGSRSGCSISAMKRWLGHGASSQMADVYMKPVTPESRDVVEFVRTALLTGKVPVKKVGKEK